MILHLSMNLDLRILQKGLLWRGQRIYVPEKLRKKALTLAHEAHQGIVRCKQRYAGYCSGPGWTRTLKSFAEIVKRACAFSHFDETHLILQPLFLITAGTSELLI